ncbi:MAG TPA: c-type cytochrome, partial [Spirochaetota bacterium]|nr:c-type cytochrome [Spirochaetota bacterium]
KSIAAYERSHELNPFNSRFDDFWRKAVAAGRAVDKIDEKNMAAYTGLGLSDREVRGLMLFNKKGKCAECHVLTTPGAHPPLLTDFTYDNLGTPRNPRNPFYTQERQWNPDGTKWADPGLGGFLKGDPRFARHAAANMGKHKVPTLRNVDLRESASFVKAYLHNGVFTSLKEVVDFYNTRDRDKKRWGPPEVSANVNTEELGDLKLTDDEVGAIVDFMKTLSDR